MERGKNLAILATLSLASLLSSKANATLDFPTSGVWSEPRIFSGTTLATEPLSLNEQYSFKTKLINPSDQPESDYLTAQITGPQDYTLALDYGLITLNPNSDSIRTRTFSEGFSIPGDYNITMNLNSDQTISKDFQVIPEPLTFALLGIGTAPLIRRAKRKRK